MSVETRDSDEMFLAELDHDTSVLLEDRINWNSKYYAEVCADAIRRDYTLATRRALARGVEPEKAVGRRLDPDLFASVWNPPYLKRTEEEWLKSFLVDEHKAKPSRLVILYVVGIMVLTCVAWYLYGVVPLLGSFLFQQIIVQSIILMPILFGSHIKHQIVLRMGPTGCALANGTQLFLFVICAALVGVNYISKLQWLNVALAVGVLVCLLWYGVSFSRKRRRIRAHYGAVCRILGLPGADALGDAMPGG